MFFFSFLQLLPPLLPNPPSSSSQLPLRTLIDLSDPDQPHLGPPPPPLCLCAAWLYISSDLGLYFLLRSFVVTCDLLHQHGFFPRWSGLSWSWVLPPRLPCSPLSGTVGLGVGFQEPGTNHAWNLVPSPVGSSCLLLLPARNLHGGCPL